MDIINTFLTEAIKGESEAEQRYVLYAEKAIKDGFNGVATLFTGLSYAEAIHIANHQKALEKNNFTGPLPDPDLQPGAGSTLENLHQAIEGEKEEFSTMYPSFYKKINKMHGREFIAKIALLSIKWALESEKNHHFLLEKAAKAVRSKNDLDNGDIYLCSVCGNLHYSADFPTELCPICGHDLSFYTKVELLS